MSNHIKKDLIFTQLQSLATNFWVATHGLKSISLEKHRVATQPKPFCKNLSYFFLFFFSTFILLTRRKATGAIIRRVTNYLDLLTEMPRKHCTLEIHVARDMTIIYNACQDYQAGENVVKCFSKDTTEWRKWVLNQKHVDHNHKRTQDASFRGQPPYLEKS